MKNLSEMLNDVELELDKEYQAKLKKYKTFMKLISDCFNVIIPSSVRDAVKSYIDGTSQKFIRLSYHDADIHYNYIDIAVNDSQELKIVSFSAHDAYYDPSVNFESDDKSIVGFFDREFRRFEEWLTSNGTISTIKLVNSINAGIYGAYESDFKKLKISESNFEFSEYALKLDNYEEITAKIKELSDESGLDL